MLIRCSGNRETLASYIVHYSALASTQTGPAAQRGEQRAQACVPRHEGLALPARLRPMVCCACCIHYSLNSFH